MIIAAGYVYVDPADAEEFVADVHTTYPVAQANPGNILISFGVDDPAAGRITVLKQWDSHEALDRHSSTPAIIALSNKWSSRMRDETHTFHVVDKHDPGTNRYVEPPERPRRSVRQTLPHARCRASRLRGERSPTGTPRGASARRRERTHLPRSDFPSV